MCHIECTLHKLITLHIAGSFYFSIFRRHQFGTLPSWAYEIPDIDVYKIVGILRGKRPHLDVVNMYQIETTYICILSRSLSPFHSIPSRPQNYSILLAMLTFSFSNSQYISLFILFNIFVRA